MAEQKEMNRDEAGNTGKQPQQHVYWFFTYNGYKEPDENKNIEILEMILKHECDWYIFQEEKGDTTGNLHLQGTLKLKKRKRLSEMKKLNSQICWKPTIKIESSITYCTKEKTLCGKRFAYGIEIPEVIDVEEPYGWQLQIVEMIKTKPDKRSIYWYWESSGNIGKSTFAKWLCVKKNALLVSGKGADVKYAIANLAIKPKILIYDIPRANKDYVSYGCLEEIKNGLFFSGKFKSGMVTYNCPHVIIFANQPPERDKLSADRWIIVSINGEEEPKSVIYDDDMFNVSR